MAIGVNNVRNEKHMGEKRKQGVLYDLQKPFAPLPTPWVTNLRSGGKSCKGANHGRRTPRRVIRATKWGSPFTGEGILSFVETEDRRPRS